MSRLLHAAARGARIQGYICGKWMLTAGICPDVDRIHPEDVHLQYGPISTEVLEEAKTAKRWYYTGLSEGIEYAILRYTLLGEIVKYDSTDEFHRSLFLLILAEALADEGL